MENWFLTIFSILEGLCCEAVGQVFDFLPFPFSVSGGFFRAGVWGGESPLPCGESTLRGLKLFQRKTMKCRITPSRPLGIKMYLDETFLCKNALEGKLHSSFDHWITFWDCTIKFRRVRIKVRLFDNRFPWPPWGYYSAHLWEKSLIDRITESKLGGQVVTNFC